MNRRKSLTPRQLAREKILFRYSTAVEHGDFDALADILREAEGDPILEKMIWEINEVYRAEFPVATPSLNLFTNHNHRNTREDESMTIYTNPNRLSQADTGRARWHWVTLAAAILALVVFSAALLAVRKPTDPQDGNLAVLQDVTGTPTREPFATFTPTPSFTPIFPSVPVTVCRVFNPGTEAVRVHTQPFTNSDPIGTLPRAVIVDVIRQEVGETDGRVWYNISFQLGDASITGWVRSDTVTPVRDCESPDNTVATVLPTVVNAQAVALSVLCHGFVPMADGIDLLSRPSANAVAIGRLPLGTLLDILDQEWHIDESPSVWFFVSAIVDNMVLQGWISGRYLSFTDECPPPAEMLSMQATSEAMLIHPIDPVLAQTLTALPPCVAVQPALTFTPTPAVEFSHPLYITTPMPVEKVTDPLYLTATAVVAWATENAPTAVSPTTVPSVFSDPCPEVVAVPCVTGTQPFLVMLPSPTPNLLIQPVELTATAVVVYATASVQAMTPSISPCMPTGTPTPFDFVPVPPGATPTAGLESALGSGEYNLVVLENVGDILSGTLVQLAYGYFDGSQWIYGVTTQDGRAAEVRESQLAVVTGQPGQSSTATLVPSPTDTFTPTPSQ